MLTCSLDGTVSFIELNKFTITKTFYGHCADSIQSQLGGNKATKSVPPSRASTSQSSRSKGGGAAASGQAAGPSAARTRILQNAEKDAVCTMGFSKMGKMGATATATAVSDCCAMCTVVCSGAACSVAYPCNMSPSLC